jgi:hypothetical protein
MEGLAVSYKNPVGKQKYKTSNWPEYNKALKRTWYNPDRIYDGAGTPKMYTNFAILICHEVRQVLRLPLRQAEGFINSIFRLKHIPISCANYTTLSRH